MRKHFFTRISLQVIAIFTTAILVSMIPDHLHAFFGDTHCLGSGHYIRSTETISAHWERCNVAPFSGDEHDPTWHWGYRHILWSWMGIALAIIQIIRLIYFIDKNKS
jgi:hypothetical protein